MEAEHTKAKDRATQMYLEKNKYGRKNQTVVDKYQNLLHEVRTLGCVGSADLFTYTVDPQYGAHILSTSFNTLLDKMLIYLALAFYIIMLKYNKHVI